MNSHFVTLLTALAILLVGSFGFREVTAAEPPAKSATVFAPTCCFVVWDKAGAITLRAQNPKSYTKLGQADPYPALFQGTPVYAILNGFPWERLQFLPMDYGKP
jgi:hypothetical protein